MKRTATVCIVLMTLLAVVGCGKDEPTATEAVSKAPTAPEVGLNEAVIVGNMGAIKQHIAAGTNLDEKDAYGSSPLIVAATFGVTDAANVLIEGGADLNLPNNEGSTPLHISAFLCYTEIVEALLDAGADKNLKNGAGHTALQSVEGDFAASKPAYDGLGAALGPLGLKLDYK